MKAPLPDEGQPLCESSATKPIDTGVLRVVKFQVTYR